MIFLCLVSFLFVVILYMWLSLIKDSKKLGVPGPFPLPIIGDGHLFLGDSANFLKALRNLSEKYGSVTRFYIFSNRYLLVKELKLIEAIITSTEHLVKGRSYDFLDSWLGEGLLTSAGHRWKMHRKFLTPAFHFNILQNFLPIFMKNNKTLIDKLKAFGSGTDINLLPIIAFATLDNVTESVMGVPLKKDTDSGSDYVKSIGDLINILAYRMRNGFASQNAIFNLMPIKQLQTKALNTVHKHARHVIECRRKELQNLDVKTLNIDNELGIKNRFAFLDSLLLAEIDGKKIDDECIREEVDTFLFAGHDTTTAGLSFTLYCISRNKEVQEKVLKEQRDIIGDDIERDPTFGEIQQMKYLDCVIKESLRLYPPAPMIERYINRDAEIGGMFVPKDTTFVVNIMHMQRDPSIYENPLEFRPERFENASRNPFSWLAFSAGPRNCIGQKFALLEIKVIVSAIIRHFKLLPSNSEPVLGMDLTLRSQNGLFIQLMAR